MKATLTFHEDVKGTIFQQETTGHVVRAYLGDSDQVVFLTDCEGESRLNGLLRGDIQRALVTDLLTGTKRALKRADCGLGCRCAVKLC